MTDRWMTIVEYARFYNISDMTVRRRIKTGKLQAILKDGKYYIPIGQEHADQNNQIHFSNPVGTTPHNTHQNPVQYQSNYNRNAVVDHFQNNRGPYSQSSPNRNHIVNFNNNMGAHPQEDISHGSGYNTQDFPLEKKNDQNNFTKPDHGIKHSSVSFSSNDQVNNDFNETVHHYSHQMNNQQNENSKESLRGHQPGRDQYSQMNLDHSSSQNPTRLSPNGDLYEKIPQSISEPIRQEKIVQLESVRLLDFCESILKRVEEAKIDMEKACQSKIAAVEQKIETLENQLRVKSQNEDQLKQKIEDLQMLLNIIEGSK